MCADEAQLKALIRSYKVAIEATERECQCCVDSSAANDGHDKTTASALQLMVEQECSSATVTDIEADILSYKRQACNHFAPDKPFHEAHKEWFGRDGISEAEGDAMGKFNTQVAAIQTMTEWLSGEGTVVYKVLCHGCRLLLAACMQTYDWAC